MEHKCAFNQTLIGDQFGCEHAAHVVRRGGPDIACAVTSAAARCEAFLQRLKQEALPAFGVADDLLSMPHSVLVKIQFGGLLGTQRLLDAPGAGAERIANINDLVTRAVDVYGAIQSIPCAQLLDNMVGFKPRRRGTR